MAVKIKNNCNNYIRICQQFVVVLKRYKIFILLTQNIGNADKIYNLLFIETGRDLFFSYNRSTDAHGVILVSLESPLFRCCVLYTNRYSSRDDSYISGGGCVNTRVCITRIFSMVAA